MDKFTGKRAVGGLGVSKRGSGLTFRDAPNREDRSVQYCNRLGCSTRLNSMKSNEVGSSGRVKYSNPSFRSTTGKAIVGSSSKTYSNVTDLKKPLGEYQSSSSHKKTVSRETNNVKVQNEVLESSPSTSRIQTDPPVLKDAESGVLKDLSVGTLEENRGTQKQFHKRSTLVSQDTSPGSSTRRSFTPKNTTPASRPASQAHGSNTSQYGLKNLGCASLSDGLPSRCSSSDSSHSRRVETVKRVGKTLTGSSSGENLGGQRSSLSSPSPSLSERPSSSQPASRRRTRYWPPSRDGITSVRTRRTVNGETRTRLSEHGNGNGTSLSEPAVVVSQLPQTELSTSGSTQSGSSQTELPTIHQNSSRRMGSRNENVRDRQFIHSEDGSTRPFNGLSIDRDGLRRFNMDGIAEVLLALERIEQDEELTYEQFLALETNMFFGGLSFHDQHRDMRLDIDNMSYEELLALGERMGTVSTALTEEELSNCLKRSSYVPSPPDMGIVACGDDDVKCSVCQEDFVEGEDVGKLGCDHRYHVDCIRQWLQLKNWCPICKSRAAAS